MRRFVISDLARHVHLVQRLVERQRLVHERDAQAREFRDDGKRVRAPRDDVLGRERQGLVELPVEFFLILLRHRSERKAHPLAQIDDRAERSSLVDEEVSLCVLEAAVSADNGSLVVCYVVSYSVYRYFNVRRSGILGVFFVESIVLDVLFGSYR